MTHEQENSCMALASIFASVRTHDRVDVLQAMPITAEACEWRDSRDEPIVVATFEIDPDGTLHAVPS